MIVNISGPSGSGKTTLINHLICKYPLIYNRLVPYTSRYKRPHEEDGIDYHFVYESFFNNNNDIVLQRKREDGLYAILSNDLFSQNDKILLSAFPPKGVLKLENLGLSVACFYLLVCPSDCEKRMIARGDKIDKIHNRLDADQHESDLETEMSILHGRQIEILDGSMSVEKICLHVHNLVCLNKIV